MVLTRASGTDLASSLKRNTFWTLGVRPDGGRTGPRDGGARGAPGYVVHRNSLSRVNQRHLPKLKNTSPFGPSVEGRVFPA